jgi:hypothetical protein
LLRFSKYDEVSNGDNIEFHTPYLKLDNSNVSWILKDENSSVAVPQVDLLFNYPINPTSLKEKLLIEVDGKPVDYLHAHYRPIIKYLSSLRGSKPKTGIMISISVLTKVFFP